MNRTGVTLLPTAAALAAAGVESQAAIVQINLGVGYSFTSTATLNPDVTGDGLADLTITGEIHSSNWAYAIINGGSVQAELSFRQTYSAVLSRSIYKSFFLGDPRFASGGLSVNGDSISRSVLNPINFSDSRINGGTMTKAFLQVNAYQSGSEVVIDFSRLVFDDADPMLGTTVIPSTTYAAWTPVPEPSSIGLLALGAGGLVLRRRRKAQAA